MHKSVLQHTSVVVPCGKVGTTVEGTGMKANLSLCTQAFAFSVVPLAQQSRRQGGWSRGEAGAVEGVRDDGGGVVDKAGTIEGP